MKTISVDVQDLLKHLRTNREQHIIDYNEAMVGWQEAVIEAFTNGLKKAKKHEDFTFVNPARPISYESSYDTVIEQLEWTLDKSVDLDQSEFKQYVQDDWGWKTSFNLTSSLYNGKAAQ